MKHDICINELSSAVSTSMTLWEVSQKTKIGTLRLVKLIEKHHISTKHFTPGKKRKKDTLMQKKCLQCGSDFSVNRWAKQYTCSRSCANMYFRSGVDHGSYIENGERKPAIYRRICFKEHGRKCICCDEKFAVDVHHIDGDNLNNKLDNLIPLCANHHRYFHSSKMKHIVEEKIQEFIGVWRNGKLSRL